MAETNFNLNFKYGLSTNLKGLEKNNGTIYVTTDERSMYVDLNGERFRLGDVLMYDTLKDLAADHKSWYKNSLAFVAEKKLLAYYNGTEWVNINDTSELTKALSDRIDAEATTRAAADTALGGRIDVEKARAEGVEAGLNTAIQGNATEIANIKTEIGTKSDTNKATSIWDAIESLSGNSTTTLGALEAKIDQEITNRGTADTALDNRLKDVEAFLESADLDTDDKNVIDTLKEIQEYIKSDETGAADMLAAINALKAKTVLGTDAESKEYATVKAYVEAIQAAILTASQADATNKANAAQAAAEATAAADATAKANAAQAAAEATAAADAKTKADAAQAAAEATAKGYADAAQAAAVVTAGADAKTKADDALAAAKTYADGKADATLATAKGYADTQASAAQTNAEATAAADATKKANDAEENAKNAAAADATAKADAALASAKSYADGKMTWGTF